MEQAIIALCDRINELKLKCARSKRLFKPSPRGGGFSAMSFISSWG
jgi:hypothetical protein